MTPSIAPRFDPESPADVAAHEGGTYVRRTAVPSQDTPKPPAEPAARRRFIQQREW